MLPDTKGHEEPEDMKTFTVTIAGTERFDGEAPYTWVVEAPDVASAMNKALAYHALSQDQQLCDLEIDPLHTFEGPPLKTAPTTGTTYDRPPSKQTAPVNETIWPSDKAGGARARASCRTCFPGAPAAAGGEAGCRRRSRRYCERSSARGV
jgi:hypothetical protein